MKRIGVILSAALLASCAMPMENNIMQNDLEPWEYVLIEELPISIPLPRKTKVTRRSVHGEPETSIVFVMDNLPLAENWPGYTMFRMKKISSDETNRECFDLIEEFTTKQPANDDPWVIQMIQNKCPDKPKNYLGIPEFFGTEFILMKNDVSYLVQMALETYSADLFNNLMKSLLNSK